MCWTAVRPLTGLIAAAAPFAAAAGIAGCAGTAHRVPAHPTVYLTQPRRVYTYAPLHPRTRDGVRFLVPVGADRPATELIATTHVNVSPRPAFPPRSTPPGIDASVTAVIRRPHRIELVATGPAGRPVDITWEETCGYQSNPTGSEDSGGIGGNGEMRARLPAVVAITLPRWSSGQDACYVASTLVTNRYQRGLSDELINF